LRTSKPKAVTSLESMSPESQIRSWESRVGSRRDGAVEQVDRSAAPGVCEASGCRTRDSGLKTRD